MCDKIPSFFCLHRNASQSLYQKEILLEALLGILLYLIIPVEVLPQRPGFRHHRKENYVCRDALSRQSTECSEVQEVSQSQLQQPRVKLNGSTVETPSHHDLHRELLVSTKRGLLPGEKPELKRVLEQRRLEQHREQELALQPPLELEMELRKRQQILLEYEQEEIRRREEQEREVPEFVRVKDNLRRTQVSGQ
uniref:protein FAM107B-like isoform X1 n=1 Tax=Oncorhynchus gorbuscha TaxID=8017 RepID=UPI001EAF4357|nr:protein FAM107B-like isoform X1 [Oncorhynchus gorbuscha]